MSEKVVFIGDSGVAQVATKEVVFVSHEAPQHTAIAAGAQGPAGPKGDQGLQGLPGLAGASYEHLQAIPAATWTINHGLGRFPSVTVVDSAGSVVVGNIEYVSNNTVVLYFSAAFGGSAYLN